MIAWLFILAAMAVVVAVDVATLLKLRRAHAELGRALALAEIEQQQRRITLSQLQQAHAQLVTLMAEGEALKAEIAAIAGEARA